MQRTLRTALIAAACSLVALPALGQALANPGKKAQLTVEYEFVSAGERKDQYDLNQWAIRRLVTVTATLEAQKPHPLPALHKMEAGQTADMQEKQAAATRAATNMQPMMMDVMALMEKCGDDDACIEREAMAYGTGNADAINKTREQVAPDFATVSKQGADRYQMWSATGRQTASYEISETYKYVDTDPLCVELPGKQCITNITRIGKGKVPLPPDMKPTDKRVAGPSLLEHDSVAGDIIVILPSPFMVSTYEETVKSNDPEVKNETTTGQIMFPSTAVANTQFTIPMQGGLIGKSGVEKVKIKGSSNEKRTLDPTAGEDGELIIRWKFTPG